MSMPNLLARAGRDTTAAAVVSLVAISFYVSAASLMFQGNLAPHLPAMIGAVLLGSAALAAFGAWRGAMPLASVGAEPATVPVLATITAAVAAQAPADAALPTAVAALCVTTALIGALWWLMGRRGGGDVIRYIPYPVIGGFLGSVGWLMLTGGIGVSMGQAFSLDTVLAWTRGEFDVRLLTCLVLGVVIWRVALRFTHVMTLPVLVLGGALLVHAGLWLAGLDLAAARTAGWLLAPFSQTLPAWPANPALLGAVHWDVVAQQAGLMVSAAMVATIALLLSDSSLEVAWNEPADINQDLRALGLGNLAAAALGGVAGGVSISRSVLNRAAGAASRASGAIKAAICVLAMAWGGPIIALVPRPLLGGLLVYLGLGMLKTWLLDSRQRLGMADHLTIAGMVAVTAVFGFLPAVCMGVLACCVGFAVATARVSPVQRSLTRSAWPDRVERGATQAELVQTHGHDLRILQLQGQLFFGSATRLTLEVERMLAQPTPPRELVLDFSGVRWLDSSAAQSLNGLLRLLHRHGLAARICGLGRDVQETLRACGALAAPCVTVHADVDAAVAAWDEQVLARFHAPAFTFETWLVGSFAQPADSRRALSYFEPLHLAPGQALFRQGSESDALYLVREGSLAAHVEAPDGQRQLLTIQVGGVIGEMGLFRGVPRGATISALTRSELMRLHRDRLIAMERDHPALAASLYRQFLGQLSGRLDRATARANSLAA